MQGQPFAEQPNGAILDTDIRHHGEGTIRMAPCTVTTHHGAIHRKLDIPQQALTIHDGGVPRDLIRAFYADLDLLADLQHLLPDDVRLPRFGIAGRVDVEAQLRGRAGQARLVAVIQSQQEIKPLKTEKRASASSRSRR